MKVLTYSRRGESAHRLLLSPPHITTSLPAASVSLAAVLANYTDGVKDLTRVPQLAVPEHRDDDQQIAQHVHHRGENQHAGQDAYDPGGAGAPLRGQRALELPQP